MQSVLFQRLATTASCNHGNECACQRISRHAITTAHWPTAPVTGYHWAGLTGAQLSYSAGVPTYISARLYRQSSTGSTVYMYSACLLHDDGVLRLASPSVKLNKSPRIPNSNSSKSCSTWRNVLFRTARERFNTIFSACCTKQAYATVVDYALWLRKKTRHSTFSHNFCKCNVNRFSK